MRIDELKNFIRTEIAGYYDNGKQYLDSFYNSVKDVFDKLTYKDVELKLFDKEHFLKSFNSLVDSLSRRISSFSSDLSSESIKSQEFIDKFNCALEEYKDFFRINVCIHDDSLFQEATINILKMIRNIKEISFHYDNIDRNYKNSFKESSECKDFKIYFKYKEKYPFEIQFHNTSSENMNLATHGIYEVYRAQDLRADYKEKLGKDRISLYKLVIPPVFDEKAIKEEGLES